MAHNPIQVLAEEHEHDRGPRMLFDVKDKGQIIRTRQSSICGTLLSIEGDDSAVVRLGTLLIPKITLTMPHVHFLAIDSLININTFV